MKAVPMRTCIGCGQIRGKGELIRIVRTPEGTVAVDRTGRMSGRGAYLCPDPECLRRAAKRRSMSRAFRTGVAAEEYEHLRIQLEEVRRGPD